MPSAFAWLDYSEHDRRKVLDVIDLFREKGTVDELGIGTVRDAIADSMFPGISTIQTRARYFLFVPWIYLDIENRKMPSRDVARFARDKELRLSQILTAGDDNAGAIGKDAGMRLQRLPSMIYWQGLEVYGIRQFRGSQDQYHRSLDRFYQGRAPAGASTDDDVTHLIRPRTNWHDGLPPAPEGFPEGAALALDKDEADYLRERIMINAPRTFMAFLVDQSSLWSPTDAPWQHPEVGRLPPAVRETLRHAEHFSLAMWGAALLYNHALASKRVEPARTSKAEELIERYEEDLQAWLQLLAEHDRALRAWAEQRSEFWSFIRRFNPRVPMPTRQFVDAWLDSGLDCDTVTKLVSNERLHKLIESRERRLKGPLARLLNPRALELWGGASGADRLGYRWRQAQNIAQDIIKGLGRGA
jgi:hypothetical protein